MICVCVCVCGQEKKAKVEFFFPVVVGALAVIEFCSPIHLSFLSINSLFRALCCSPILASSDVVVPNRTRPLTLATAAG